MLRCEYKRYNGHCFINCIGEPETFCKRCKKYLCRFCMFSICKKCAYWNICYDCFYESELHDGFKENAITCLRCLTEVTESLDKG